MNTVDMHSAARDEARRVLAARQDPPRGTFTGCAGPCDQGRRLCPCPAVCRRADRHDDLAPFAGILVALALVGAVVAVVALLHWSMT